MTYARIEDNAIAEYPVYEGDIRLRHPNVSFASPFTPPEGYVRVADIAQPKIDYTQNLSEGTPVRVQARNDDGTFKADDPATPESEVWIWQRNWVVTEASPAEREARTAAQWELVRRDRNAKLDDTDRQVTKCLELGELVPEDLKAYRQALRDITTQDDPFAIVWPAGA